MVFKRVLSIVFVFALLISCKKEPKESVQLLKADLELETNAKLGEGAFWNYKTKELYWIDIENKQLNIYNPSTKANKVFELPSKVGTVVPYTDMLAIVALEDGIYKINLNSSELMLLSDVASKEQNTRLNDGKCDPNGNLWVGSMDDLEYKNSIANLYKVDVEGNSTKMIEGVAISNGIVWTKDAKTMYYIDTPTGKIMAYDFDKTTSTISNGRIAVDIPKEVGSPDGMAIDEEDMLWVGLWNGNAVARYNPLTGKLIAKVDVPAHNVTSCAFGGDNLDELFITTASIDMTDEEQEKYPLSGSVFKVKVDVKGVKSTFFGESN